MSQIAATSFVVEEKPKESAFVSSTGNEINWVHTILLVSTPVIATFGLLFVRPSLYTIIFTVFLYFWTGLGITGGMSNIVKSASSNLI
jgi:hypothetical protein